jgi:hypothetical protein
MLKQMNFHGPPRDAEDTASPGFMTIEKSSRCCHRATGPERRRPEQHYRFGALGVMSLALRACP